MRNSILVALAGAALLVAGAAYAGDTAASSGSTDADTIICKSGPPPTGTRLGPTRVCKTKLQWDKEQEEAQRNLARTQIQRGMGNSGN